MKSPEVIVERLERLCAATLEKPHAYARTVAMLAERVWFLENLRWYILNDEAPFPVFPNPYDDFWNAEHFSLTIEDEQDWERFGDFYRKYLLSQGRPVECGESSAS